MTERFLSLLIIGLLSLQVLVCRELLLWMDIEFSQGLPCTCWDDHMLFVCGLWSVDMNDVDLFSNIKPGWVPRISFPSLWAITYIFEWIRPARISRGDGLHLCLRGILCSVLVMCSSGPSRGLLAAYVSSGVCSPLLLSGWVSVELVLLLPEMFSRTPQQSCLGLELSLWEGFKVQIPFLVTVVRLLRLCVSPRVSLVVCVF